MATTGGNWTGGNPPFNHKHKPAPLPFKAVASRTTDLHGGDLTQNRVVGQPVAQEVAIVVNGVNLLDVIADLQRRLTALNG